MEGKREKRKKQREAERDRETGREEERAKRGRGKKPQQQLLPLWERDGKGESSGLKQKENMPASEVGEESA